MAGEQDDPVGGGVTDGDASFGGGSTTTPSRGGFEDFTIDELRDQIIGDSHEAEGAARELGRRTRTEQKGALAALIALARIGSTHALIALRDMKKLPEDLQQRANDQGIFELVDSSTSVAVDGGDMTTEIGT